jgi:glutamyl-Q tRNA(Asp) synthetase
MPPTRPTVTRFAPSPTGYLHLGHAYAALFAAQKTGNGEAATGTQKSRGRFLLRIEDIDTSRIKAQFEDAIFEDMAWLGLEWELPVRRQSEHFDEYRRALEQLEDRGLVYPCFCTRREIRAEIRNSGAAPHDAPPGAPAGTEGPLYPGTCRRLSDADRLNRGDRPFALRLDSAKAIETTGPLTWCDAEKGDIEAAMDRLGDVVLARKETPASYHLAVTIDDHLQGVTLVTRGEDLFSSTHVHRVLQALLGLDTPAYHHHRLLTDDDGARLAKRDMSLTIRALREAGQTPDQVRAMAGFGDGQGNAP